jgi:hypothetical protein
MRAAFYIARRYAGEPPKLREFLGQARVQAAEMLDKARRMVDKKWRGSGQIARTRLEIQERMSSCGAAIRDPEKISLAVGQAWTLYTKMQKELRVRSAKELPDAFRNLDLGLTHALYLEAIHEYLTRGGKSRGSYLVLDRAGEKPCAELGEEWRFSLNPRPSFVDQKILEISLDERGGVAKKWVGIRAIPSADNWFENVWKDFREDRIIGDKE